MAFKALSKQMTAEEVAAAQARRKRLVKHGGRPKRPVVAVPSARQSKAQAKPASPAQGGEIVKVADTVQEETLSALQSYLSHEPAIDPMDFLEAPDEWNPTQSQSSKAAPLPISLTIGVVEEKPAAAITAGGIVPASPPVITGEISQEDRAIPPPRESQLLRPVESGVERPMTGPLVRESGIMFNGQARSPFSNFMTKVL